MQDRSLTQIFTGIASAVALSASTSLAHAEDSSQDRVRDALLTIMPYQKALKATQDGGNNSQENQEKAIEYSRKLLESQRNITDLFGPGSEGQYHYDYRGKRISADIDCDAATISFSSTGIRLEPTTAMVSDFHAKLNNIYQAPSDKEARMLNMATESFAPLTHNDVKSFARHVFLMPKENENGYYGSYHQIPFDVTNDMINTVCATSAQNVWEDVKTALRDPEFVGELQERLNDPSL